VLFALPDRRLLGLVSHQTKSGEAFHEHRIGLDHLALSVLLEDLPTWAERLGAARVEYSPPVPSAFGDPLIALRDPDNVQLQLYGISEPPPA
jgi:glyoxylase I family protein